MARIVSSKTVERVVESFLLEGKVVTAELARAKLPAATLLFRAQRDPRHGTTFWILSAGPRPCVLFLSNGFGCD